MMNRILLLASNLVTFLVTLSAVVLYHNWDDTRATSSTTSFDNVMGTIGARHLQGGEGGDCSCSTSAPTSPPVTDQTTAPTSLPAARELPLLESIEEFTFIGAFRLRNGQFGVSSLDYATGTLAYNPARNSLFIVGHEEQQAIAEYPIINGSVDVGVAAVVDLPETSAPLQDFIDVLGRISNPDALNRITGMMVLDEVLYVNLENWYDAGGASQDTSLYFPDTSNLGGSDPIGFFRLQGRSQSAGYMGRIPMALQPLFDGAQYYTGWSSVYSILSRYSLGPSLWTFSPQDSIRDTSNKDVTATPFLNYPYSDSDPSKWLSTRATEWSEQGTSGPFPPSDPLWNPLSEGRFAFFVPHTRTFCVIGSTAGLTSGIGYKAIQSNGHECPGPCPYEPDDWYNYYWLYDVDDIVRSTDPSEPRPYAYGAWRLPYVTNPELHRIIGATIDDERHILYIALSNAAKVGTYDQPPLVIAYDIMVAPPSSDDHNTPQDVASPPQQDVPPTSGASSAFWGR